MGSMTYLELGVAARRRSCVASVLDSARGLLARTAPKAGLCAPRWLHGTDPRMLPRIPPPADLSSAYVASTSGHDALYEHALVSVDIRYRLGESKGKRTTTDCKTSTFNTTARFLRS